MGEMTIKNTFLVDPDTGKLRPLVDVEEEIAAMGKTLRDQNQDQEGEAREACQDSLTYGIGAMRDGRHIPYAEIIKCPVETDEAIYPTTAEHFETYRREFLRWIRYFGLLQWHVMFAHAEIESRAQIAVDWYGQQVTTTFGSTWTEEPTEAQISRTAFHEVTELFLAPLTHALRVGQYLPMDEVDQRAHTIIRTMENTVWAGNHREAPNA